VLKQALIADGLARGLRESAKALDKRQALLCVLSENCDEPMYKKLVTALCMEHGIPLIKVWDIWDTYLPLVGMWCSQLSKYIWSDICIPSSLPIIFPLFSHHAPCSPLISPQFLYRPFTFHFSLTMYFLVHIYFTSFCFFPR
jgi:hypothetical protein